MNNNAGLRDTVLSITKLPPTAWISNTDSLGESLHELLDRKFS